MNFNYDYALQDVCRLGYTQYIDYYLNLGANINRGLYGACEGGHIDLVELIIEKGANDWNRGLIYANDWNRGLMGACEGGHIEIIRLLIEKGANNWVLGLQGACEQGHLEIVELIIDKGAKYEGQPIYLRHKEIRGPKKIMI